MNRAHGIGLQLLSELPHVDVQIVSVLLLSWPPYFYRIKTFGLDLELSGNNVGLLSKRTTRVSVGLLDYQHNIVWQKKLGQRQIHNAINNNRIQTETTLKPRKKITSWFVLTRGDCGWNEPTIIPIETQCLAG